MDSALQENVDQSEHNDPLAVGNDGVLPTDVLRDVLLHLPADELCRLRLVCRSWRSLTSDPIFAKAHSSRHPLIVGLHMQPRPIRRGSRGFDVHFVDPFSGDIVKQVTTGRAWDVHKLSTNHGRLCISADERYDPEKNRVLNPATGAITMLPDTSKHENESTSYGSSTCFLGCVPSTGEYKVIRIRRRHERRNLVEEVELDYHIATLGGDGNNSDAGWRVMPCPPVDVTVGSLGRAVVKGVAYFLLDIPHWPAKSDDILEFDLDTEEWRYPALRGPFTSHNISAEDEDRVWESFHLANLNGCLVGIYNYHRRCRYTDCSMDLWFLVDAYKELWTKRYSLQLASIAHPCGVYFPLVILDDGRVLIWVHGGVQKLKAYDPRTSAWTNIPSLVDNLLFSVCIYHGSLLCSDTTMD
ncbi:hypothetical protein HU200_061463 [Digitaria exilis]|uniref:F-box domain-containing protein n=1 Tax=Digitaria exilis TaxID=1010633 RepID=A0A835AAG1_9POAL|nr:hypothetical protein HU200_061463 [Digitaria exilis]